MSFIKLCHIALFCKTLHLYYQIMFSKLCHIALLCKSYYTLQYIINKPYTVVFSKEIHHTIPWYQNSPHDDENKPIIVGNKQTCCK